MGKGRFKGQLPDEMLAFFQRAGKAGGKLSAAARMEKLTPERRSEIARNAVAARIMKAAKKKAAAKKGAH
jgi:hypothetical protein